MMLILALLLASAPNPSPPPDATAGRRGLVNTTTQTFGGAKTFTDGGVVINGNLFVDGGLIIRGGLAPATISTAPIILYVDQELGSDLNTCTIDGGVFACATISRAIDQLPMFSSHNVQLNVAGGADGGVRDYAGFNLATSQIRKTDGGFTTTINIIGTLGRVNLSTGLNFGQITSYDAGGITADGGTFPNMLAYSTATVAGAGWTTNELRGKFARTIRYDGGSLLTYAIYENSADTFTPAISVTAATWALSGYVEIIEPKTRITSAAPGTGAPLLSLDTLPAVSGASTTIRNFDFVQPSTTGILSTPPGANINLTNDRIYYGNVTDSMSLAQDSTLTVTSSVLVSSGSRYFITASGRGSRFSLGSSLITGSAKNIFVRLDQGEFAYSNNTFWNISAPIQWTIPQHCPTRGSYLNNRFILMSFGPYMVCQTDTQSVELASNAFDGIDNDAIYIGDNVNTTTNLTAVAIVHSD